MEGFGELECHIYVLEAEYCPFLFDHLFAVRCLALQVEAICYERNNVLRQIVYHRDVRNNREAEHVLWQHIGEVVKPIDELEDGGGDKLLGQGGLE